MLRHLIPATLAVAGLLLAPAPVWAHAGGGGGDEDCCKEEARSDAKAEAQCCDKDMADCCADGTCEPPCDKKDMKGDRPGMRGHHGDKMDMKGHHGMRGMLAGKQFSTEIRYLPVFNNSTNQWLMLSGGIRGQKNEAFSLGFERNLAIQTFNNGPTGFWLAPYGGIVPRVGYAVGDARVDLGLLVGAGGMARTANVGGTSDVLQARLMWVLEPKAELMWQGDGHGLGLTASYLMTQHQADLGGFVFGLKGTFGGKGGGKGMGHHGDKDRKGDHKGHKH